MRNVERKKTWGSILWNHILLNKKAYIIITMLFIIGILLGVVFINNTNDSQQEKIQNYITSFISQVKEQGQIDKIQLLKNTLLDNTKLAILLWFVGSTVIGIPIVYGIIVYRGFCIGYTIACAIATLGTAKGIVFLVSTIVIHSILFIPALFALAVSGIKLYQSIVKDKRKENVKLEIYRHTLFSIVMLIIFLISAFIEVYVSSNLFTLIVGYL